MLRNTGKYEKRRFFLIGYLKKTKLLCAKNASLFMKGELFYHEEKFVGAKINSNYITAVYSMVHVHFRRYDVRDNICAGRNRTVIYKRRLH